MAGEKIVQAAPIWEPLPGGETEKAYAAFCLYRDLDPTDRSIVKAYALFLRNNGVDKEPKIAPRNWQDWSANNRWIARALAYDTYLDQQRRERRQRQRVKLEDREFNDYEKQLGRWDKAFEAVKLHIRSSQTVMDDGTIVNFMALNTRELRRLTNWREDITKQGRRALGMPERITQNEIDLSKGLPGALIYLPARDEGQLPDEGEDDGLPTGEEQ